MGLAALALACTATNTDEISTTGSSSGTSAVPDTSGASSTGGQTTGSTGAEEPTTGPGGSSGGASGESSGTGASSSGDPGTGETGAAVVRFSDVYEQVILPNSCNSGYCHGDGAGGLEMTDEATSYANLVDVSAVKAACGQSMRVVPGSLEASILWYRVRPAALDGGPACAPKMKPGSMGLTEAEAQLVSDWIVGGALE